MRLLIIDDDVELGSMLTSYLEGEGFDTQVARDGLLGVRAAIDGSFDAVILDVMMPRMDGIEVLRRLRRASDVPVIMLTARGDNIDRVVGLDMGADDYIAKPCYPPELVARIRAVLRRRPRIRDAGASSAVLRRGLEVLPHQRRARYNDAELDLTASEFNVLEVILRAGEDVVSKDELSLRALGRKREPYDRSLDVHVSNLRQKLMAAGVDGVKIDTVRGLGYRILLA